MSGEKWIKQREMPLDREVYYQPDLPYFEQQEKKEIFKLHQDRLWRRWFAYYKKCRDPEKRLTLIGQYNKIFSLGKERQ